MRRFRWDNSEKYGKDKVKGMRKRLLTLVLAVSLAMTTSVMGAEVQIENPVEMTDIQREECRTEEKVYGSLSDEFANPITLAVGTQSSGSITEDNRQRVYAFSLGQSGRMTINMTSYMRYYSMYIYDSTGKNIWETEFNEWNSNLQYRSDAYTVDLENGNYYLKVTGYRYDTNEASTGIYNFSTQFVSAGESCAEPNDDFATASFIGINGTLNGQIAVNDRYDIYYFNVPQDGRITFNMTSYMRYYSMYIYDYAGKEIWGTDFNEWNENLKYRSDGYDVDLTTGNYYLKITGYRYRTSDASTGNYTLGMSYAAASVTFTEPNNDFITANAISSGGNILGHIAINDRFDNYKFSISKKQNIRVHITSYMKYYTIVLYDSTGEKVWYTDGNEWNENVGYRSDSYTIEDLSAGSYYLKVTGYRYGESDGSTGTYIFSIDTSASLADAVINSIPSKTCTGKALKPSVTVTYNGTTLRKGVDYTILYKNNKNPGKATVIVTGIGEYTGTQSASFYILPKKVTLKSAKNTGKGTVTLKWKKDSTVSGYEIYRSYYSSNKNYFYLVKSLGKKKTSYKQKGLYRGSTYYYKVRAYKIVNGTKLYGKFSKLKKVKIRK